MTRRPVRALLLLLGIVTLLSGCSVPHTGAAAVVDGRRISVSEVQDATLGLVNLNGSSEGVTQSDVLLLLVQAPIIMEVATKYSAAVSREAAQAAADQKVPSPSASFVTALQALATLDSVQHLPEQKALAALTEITTRIAQADIEVNPRFGTFDRAAFGIVRTPSNWLPAPVPVR